MNNFVIVQKKEDGILNRKKKGKWQITLAVELGTPTYIKTGLYCQQTGLYN